AAAIVCDGKLIAAVEEERFNRVKHCAGFPTRSIQYCLQAAGIGVEELDHVGVSRKPSAHAYKRIMALVRNNSRRRRRASIQLPLAASVGSVGAASDPASEYLPVTQDGLNGNGHGRQNGNGNGHGLARAMTERLRNVWRTRDTRTELLNALGVDGQRVRAKFHRVEHHRAHLASAFFVSGFDRAALLSLDGFGDSLSTMWAVGQGQTIKVLGQVEYPHSAGVVYTAVSQFLGFPHYGDEGKVMGLASYGKPTFIDEFRDIIRTNGGPGFSLGLEYFRYPTEGVTMTWDGGSPTIGPLFSSRFADVFGPTRNPETPLSERDCNIAASLQLRLEEVVIRLLNQLHAETNTTNLGLAGGVAYNSVLNGQILRQTPFRRVFVQPAAGDSGTAIGACYHIWHGVGRPFAKRSEKASSGLRGASDEFSPYTGPEFSADEIEQELKNSNLTFEKCSDPELIERTARDIADGLVVGWFQGRMEFGPRALGNRSIIADPRRAEMKEVLNERVKKRESFRPFAPSVLAEHVGVYFEQSHPSPAMLMVYEVKPDRREEIPAVTHVDGTGRVQTVTRQMNERFYSLIEAFYERTGVPMVLNTSFNENEPIVCTPRDAIDCFLNTRIDSLVMGNYVTRRSE
ncbi:MAG TPA: carbamoyltransferase C-terminal domain-containing protein, partial [Pyrinomonadaceae bacterium]|nr:carbamoyltransferase C-terminal domain-containing protein [Pyrinomonadaceae bacterium]